MSQCNQSFLIGVAVLLLYPHERLEENIQGTEDA